MLKRSLFIVVLSLIALTSYSQRPLSDSRQNSYFTYIFKLNTADILSLYTHPKKEADEKLLHTLIDSIRTDKIWENHLPAGNYLKVYAQKNKLEYTLIENHSAFFKLMHNNYDLRFILLDRGGKTITNALVQVNGRPVPYDNKSALYHSPYSKKDSLLKIDYDGVVNYYPIKQNRYYNSRHNWIKRMWYNIENKFRKRNYSSYRYRQTEKYTGFMVFNKPLYKPNDTVKFKAFILNTSSKKPIAAPQVLVRLKQRNDEDGKILGKVSSYRDGGYEYAFVLNDSLKMNLDEEYTISLEDVSSEKYNLEKYNGNKDENEFLAQRKVYFSGNFKYEDYDLKAIHFTVRTDKKEHGPGVPLSIYFKATDENDLPVPDGRIRFTLTTVSVAPYNTRHVFVPDTLWDRKIPLDPIGETKIVIPDSIFPKANINYHINADFLNSNNELQSAGTDAGYTYDKYRIRLALSADTLTAAYSIYDKTVKTPAVISAINEYRDTISKINVTLPYKLLFNPNASSYNVETDSTDTDIDLKDSTTNVSLSGYRTADSVFVKINNERKLELWYSVFSGDKLIDEGKTAGSFYRHSYHGSHNITFAVNYIWGGEPKKEQIEVPLSDNVLTINIKQPVTVYPGQRAQTDIVVTDNKGKPVPNADLTAWSVTRKFDYSAPLVPYLDKARKGKTSKSPYEIIKLNNKRSIPLKWARWSHEIGLDSIVYYRFTHPKTIFRIEEPATDTITQIAPFVVKDGDIIPVHILYIDNRPVYFSQAEQLQRYSFRVTPGKHAIGFRTVDQNIKVDSVNVERSKKLILSINADTSINHKVSFKNVSDTLSDYEARLVNNYMVTVVNNFDQKMATLTQGDNVILLNPYIYAADNILAGPVPDNYAVFSLRGASPQGFLTEPGYSYLFEPGFLKQKSIPNLFPFQKNLAFIKGTDNYTQYVLTVRETDTLWQQFLDLRSNMQELFHNKPVGGNLTGRLNIKLQAKCPFIKNVIIYRYDDPDYIRVYPGHATDFGELGIGKYRLFFLLRGDNYDIADSIVIKPHGNNFYALNISPSHVRDSVSIKINNTINSRSGKFDANDANIENDALKLKEAFNDQYFDDSQFGTMMAGRVIASDDRQPVVGCTVRIRGTNKGVVTDVNGVFRLRVPASGKLIISYLSYQTREVNITPGVSSVIVLTPAYSSLNEVVVTGYASVRKKDVSGAVQMIEGQEAGVYIEQGAPGMGSTVFIRGLSRFTGAKPLIVIDGMLVAEMGNINPNDIADISTLKDAAATALYGAAAANGVIIINTKRKAVALQNKADTTQQSNDQSFRKNFSDYGYWQPKLTTDENGRASFSTIFPDDITNWRTFVIGINGERQSGFVEKQVKAFKPLSASFLAPVFVVEGDEMSAIGKVTNYNSDAARVDRTFTYNGKQFKQDKLEVTNSKIDTLNITATNTDSLTFEYTIKRDNGYFDGERRKIPVVKQGAKETIGIFESLNGDTTVNLKFDGAKGPVTFRAEASVLPVLMEETEKLRTYKYLCNEQLASRLKGLLMEKRIKKFLGGDFKYEKNINEVIKKLRENRKTQGTWGWWKDSDEELWISLHVIEALVDAQKDGYQVQLDKQKLTDYLVYQMESYKGRDKLVCLELLHKLEAKVDYPKYFGVIEKENLRGKGKPSLYTVSDYDKYRLTLLKQQAGVPVKLDSLLAAQHRTLFGNMYWGEDSYNFFNNSIQLTVLAYKIIKNEGKHNNLLPKIQGYFLEQRRTGDWRNTYESALILETILPDMLTADKQTKPAVLTLKGARTQTITKFPYMATLTDNEVSVTKTGTLPVYITGYQQFWNARPEKVSKDFTVDTWFEKKETRLTKLKGGETVQLKVEVTAKGDADFVMIEIPIPAGCSYESKEQSWQNNEVHREYFKEKVSIFCRKLKQGKYEFTINLIPRYSGKYTLNPAKAEMMYFPVFYGREGMRRIEIGG